ncbi:MAG: hydrogenase/urease maturation nickel metallochaperone HypA [Chloroflexota bacterium]
MHEISLVAELVEACERLADGRRVRRVRVRHASSLPEEIVRDAFALLTAGGDLGTAVLELTSFDVEARCACGFAVPLGHDDGVEPVVICSSCDALVSRPHTAELELVSVAT